ncbi:16S ribosomal RNA methyltransferase A [Metallosphaera tengchongensis]|uniref:16S ribosomal RNA methyltransferase A n=1 Tax=Metallosphaera tengchongensis TaxID=1532350 RepID=A0A6N0NUS0_9CREN|nr:16S ribosomal RNA methyltransferase A [Metallosphaera tengchongensis]QKQ99896.1 16S ribosomal RNA methyltransferase A [Metallosphaera tengchongensis]
MRLSQNFLINRLILSDIKNYISKLRPLIEIGCGKGYLSAYVNPDICIEIDQDLLYLLKEYNPVHADARFLPVNRGQIVSSLPYSITYEFFDQITQFSDIIRLTLILQEDFVKKVLEYPTYISFLINFYFNIMKVYSIPPSAFRPEPKVFSSLVIFERKRKFIPEINSIIKCISFYRNKSLRNVSRLCGLNSSNSKKVREYKPWEIEELLNSLGLNYA